MLRYAVVGQSVQGSAVPKHDVVRVFYPDGIFPYMNPLIVFGYRIGRFRKLVILPLECSNDLLHSIVWSGVVVFLSTQLLLGYATL